MRIEFANAEECGQFAQGQLLMMTKLEDDPELLPYWEVLRKAADQTLIGMKCFAIKASNTQQGSETE